MPAAGTFRIFERKIMTDMEKIARAVAARSGAERFAAVTPAEQEQAAQLALTDILAFVGGTADWEDPLFAGAVAEQCLFVLNTREEQSTIRAFVASESVEGAGSVTYAARRSALLSPRAQEYCRTLLARRNRITRA